MRSKSHAKPLRVLMLSLMLAAGAANAEPIRHGTNGAYSGYIEVGGKFGIRVGDPIERVKPKLTGQGMRYDGFSHCESYSYPKEVLDCDPSDEWEIYRVKAFLRDGDVFVRYENGKVVAIAWSFTLFPEVDM